MLSRLQALDNSKGRNKNQTTDVLIAETALKNDAVLITGDVNLRTMFHEFGGRAVSLDEFRDEFRGGVVSE